MINMSSLVCVPGKVSNPLQIIIPTLESCYFFHFDKGGCHVLICKSIKLFIVLACSRSRPSSWSSEGPSILASPVSLSTCLLCVGCAVVHITLVLLPWLLVARVLTLGIFCQKCAKGFRQSYYYALELRDGYLILQTEIKFNCIQKCRTCHQLSGSLCCLRALHKSQIVQRL